MNATRAFPNPLGLLLCDQDGKIAACEECERQYFSPYWPAAKSAALHRSGTGHAVSVLAGAEAIAWLTHKTEEVER